MHLSAETFDTSRRFKPWLLRSRRTRADAFVGACGDGPWICRADRKRAGVRARRDNGIRRTSTSTRWRSTSTRPTRPLGDDERDRLVQQAMEAQPRFAKKFSWHCFQRMPYNQIAGVAPDSSQDREVLPHAVAGSRAFAAELNLHGHDLGRPSPGSQGRQSRSKIT